MRFATVPFRKPVQSEAEIQAEVMSHLESRKWLVVRINGGGFTDKAGQYICNYVVQGINASAGFPDVLALKGRQFLLIECKTLKGKATPAQMRFAKFAIRFGVIVYVVRSKDDVDPILKEISEES